MLRLTFILLSFLLMTKKLTAQDTKQDSLRVMNRLIDYSTGSKLTIGGYVQIDYNEPDGTAPGNLDVHRLVMLFGYKFTEDLSFLTEIEYEHIEEVYVEQAFVNYSISSNLYIRGGLMLVPMGIINEYHEPPIFYGVERPALDKYIVPSTWRELGVGIGGRFDEISLRYQAYIFNGFISYKDGQGRLRGVDGLRKGRQKGIESVINTPNFSAKLDYYGILGLKLGLAGYFGRTQTDDTSVEGATVGVTMLGADARYRYKNLELRGQYIYTRLSDTDAYNELTGKDLGSKLDGFFVETAYNFMPLINRKTDKTFVVFGRYETFDTHAATAGNLVRNPDFDRNIVTLGLDFKLAPGVAIKVDYQWLDNANPENTLDNLFNAGIGVMF